MLPPSLMGLLLSAYLPECDILVPGIPVPGKSRSWEFPGICHFCCKKIVPKSLKTGLEKVWYQKKLCWFGSRSRPFTGIFGIFLAVQNSSIGDLVTDSLTHSLTQ